MITEETIKLSRILWDYHLMNLPPVNSDCILVLGSHDLRVADRAAELYHQGIAPWIIFSGGFGNYTASIWTVPEADQLAQIAVRKGVPASALLVENRSTNTGENILFTQQLLAEKNLSVHSFVLVQKPYMERRSYATLKKHWPDKAVTVTSPLLSFDDYPTAEIPMEKVINHMVGDLQRIKIYPAKGFQVYQEIPDEVWQAGERLMELGFTEYLAKT